MARLRPPPAGLRRAAILSAALRAKAGTRGGGRTHNLRLRRPTLYPIELLAQNQVQGRSAMASRQTFCGPDSSIWAPPSSPLPNRQALPYHPPMNKFFGLVLAFLLAGLASAPAQSPEDQYIQIY